MTRQTLDFYQAQLKDASLETLEQVVANATEMPSKRKIFFYAAISRGMIDSVRSAIARWLYDNQPTEPSTND